jgi:tricorn protease
MWHGRTIYFLSDRGSVPRFNLWAMSVDDRKARQITHFTDVDVHAPSIGPEEIVFEAGGQLHLLSLASGQHKPVEILDRIARNVAPPGPCA